MDSTEFETLAEETLERIAETIETADEAGDIDVDFHEGVLNISLESGKVFVVNKHSAMQQIWLSSPVSGAYHFEFDRGQSSWRSTRSDDVLLPLLQQELQKLTSLDISLT